MTSLKLIILFCICITTFTGIYDDFFVIPKLDNNALLLCKSKFIMIEVSLEGLMGFLYMLKFLQV